ncbi:MAG TPA: tail fiber protein [Cytophagales bacterium]|nr:tail fiber protein [Cytophagales bacterium]
MRNLFTLLVTYLCYISTVYAQSPEAFKYQTVIRNAAGQILANQKVSLRLSILQSTSAGSPAYVETHSPTTNEFGLVNLEIGKGTAVTGNMANIAWGSNAFFLKTEIDLAGGTAYVWFGTSQLLSVPYALYAKTAGNAFSGNYNDLSNRPTKVSTFANDAAYIKTETDPVFAASVAKNIKASDTLRWGKKLPVATAGNLLTYDGTNWVAKDLSLTSSTVGGNQSFSILPPYLCVNYCIAYEGIYPSRNGMEPFLAEIMVWGANFPPRGYAFCDGQLMSIAQNQALFSILGTTYGGNGQTTFALPDLRGRLPMHTGGSTGPGLTIHTLGEQGGSETRTLSTSQMPAHNHVIIKQ